MDYREKIYTNYVSTHTSNLYGQPSMKIIKAQFPIWKKHFGKLIAINKNSNILDVGCGDGGFVYFLQCAGFTNVAGIDCSKEQVESALRLGIKNISCNEIRGFLSGKIGVYDAIVARNILEHFTKNEMLELLTIFHNALTTNGLLVMQVPNGENIFCGRIRYGDFSHEIVFTRSSLVQILSVSGFRNIDVYSAGPVPKGFRSFFRYILWKIIAFFLSFYNLVETGSRSGIFTQDIVTVAKK
jgi:cyclopropane fatty-acyl-phospholipid synthase-like methyltransferase